MRFDLLLMHVAQVTARLMKYLHVLSKYPANVNELLYEAHRITFTFAFERCDKHNHAVKCL